MKSNLKKLRNEQLERLFSTLQEVKPGTNEYNAIVNSINELSRKDNNVTVRDIIDYTVKIISIAAPIVAVIVTNVYFYKVEHQKEEIISKQQQQISQKLIKF